MKIIFEGKKAIIEKQRFYCKAGAYDHKTRVGWVLKIRGEIVMGDVLRSNTAYGAARHEYPEYKTLKRLLEDVEYYNDIYNRRQADHTQERRT